MVNIAAAKIKTKQNFAPEGVKMKKLLHFVCVLLVAVTSLGLSLGFAACGESADENVLTVGMECGYAPFNYTQFDDSNGAVKIDNAQGYANGYDVMIAKKIAESLGKKLVIKKYEFKGLIPAVQAGTLDLIIAGMSPTAERKESIAFSDAYYQSQLVIVVKKDGKYKDAQNLDDFSGAKIAAQIGTFHDDALQAQAAAHGIIAQKPMATFPVLIAALKIGTIDGYVAEYPGAKADCAMNDGFSFINLVNNGTGFTATDEDVQIAIGLKKGSAYLSGVNEALASISQTERDSLMQTATEIAPVEN